MHINEWAWGHNIINKMSKNECGACLFFLNLFFNCLFAWMSFFLCVCLHSKLPWGINQIQRVAQCQLRRKKKESYNIQISFYIKSSYISALLSIFLSQEFRCCAITVLYRLKLEFPCKNVRLHWVFLIAKTW